MLQEFWFKYIENYTRIYKILMGIDKNNEYKSLYVDGDVRR